MLTLKVRCGNEERENSPWMDEERRKCRLCVEERETMRSECMELNEREKGRNILLKEDGINLG